MGPIVEISYWPGLLIIYITYYCSSIFSLQFKLNISENDMVSDHSKLESTDAKHA